MRVTLASPYTVNYILVPIIFGWKNYSVFSPWNYITFLHHDVWKLVKMKRHKCSDSGGEHHMFLYIHITGEHHKSFRITIPHSCLFLCLLCLTSTFKFDSYPLVINHFKYFRYNFTVTTTTAILPFSPHIFTYKCTKYWRAQNCTYHGLRCNISSVISCKTPDAAIYTQHFHFHDPLVRKFHVPLARS